MPLGEIMRASLAPFPESSVFDAFFRCCSSPVEPFVALLRGVPYCFGCSGSTVLPGPP